MAQSVSAILAQTGDLAAKARRHTGDVNEANLLVGKVMSRAFVKLVGHEPDDVISATLSNDLDRLIRARKAAN